MYTIICVTPMIKGQLQIQYVDSIILCMKLGLLTRIYEKLKNIEQYILNT